MLLAFALVACQPYFPPTATPTKVPTLEATATERATATPGDPTPTAILTPVLTSTLAPVFSFEGDAPVYTSAFISGAECGTAFVVVTVLADGAALDGAIVALDATGAIARTGTQDPGIGPGHVVFLVPQADAEGLAVHIEAFDGTHWSEAVDVPFESANFEGDNCENMAVVRFDWVRVSGGLQQRVVVDADVAAFNEPAGEPIDHLFIGEVLWTDPTAVWEGGNQNWILVLRAGPSITPAWARTDNLQEIE
jgi:hypothetical protein